MVKITNGTNVIEVSKGAFNNIYVKCGYSLMDDFKGNKVEKKTTEPLENPEPIVETPVEDYEEISTDDIKTISKWSKSQVKKFAAQQGIDISNTKNVNEAKDVIISFIEGKND